MTRSGRQAVGELKVSVLGALDIQGVDKHALGSRKARTLIKVLAVARGQPVPVPRLVDCLWPRRPPARPSQQISVLVSRLRSVLGAERLPRSDAGYQLLADWIDLDVANHLATAASRRLAAQNYASARLAAEAALALMRGELLADEPDSPWADEERAAVAKLSLDVRRTAARAALAIGDFAAAREMSEAVVAADPYDEGALQVFMAALAHGGQPGTALAAFARVRKRLREDLGVDPSPATDAVHKAILQGKPIPGLVIAVATNHGRNSRAPIDAIRVAHHAQLGGDVTQAVSTLMVAARTCFRRRDYAEAERLLTDAIELEDNADSRLLRAEVRITMGQFARAAEDARAAIVRGAGAAGMETAAWCAYYLGDFDYALTLAEEGAALADSTSTRARCLVIAGRLLHAEGELGESERRYEDARKLVDESDMSTLAAVWLAALRCDQGRACDALQLLQLPPSESDDVDQLLTTHHRQLTLARAHMMLGQVAEALSALDLLSFEIGAAEIAQFGPDGANLRAAILVTMGDMEAADLINLKELEGARAGHLRPLLEASLVGLGESRLAAGARRSSMRYLADAAHARVGPYPFRWQQRGRTRLLQARLELAAGKFERAVAAARELLVESTRSGDAVRVCAASLLEAEALAAAGEAVDIKAVGDALKRSTEVLGGEGWRLTARLANLTRNAAWTALAERQLEELIKASGPHAEGVRRFARAYMERLVEPA